MIAGLQAADRKSSTEMSSETFHFTRWLLSPMANLGQAFLLVGNWTFHMDHNYRQNSTWREINTANLRGRREGSRGRLDSNKNATQDREEQSLTAAACCLGFIPVRWKKSAYVLTPVIRNPFVKSLCLHTEKIKMNNKYDNAVYLSWPKHCRISHVIYF